MGEVWRATDTKLSREVAINIAAIYAVEGTVRSCSNVSFRCGCVMVSIAGRSGKAAIVSGEQSSNVDRCRVF